MSKTHIHACGIAFFIFALTILTSCGGEEPNASTSTPPSCSTTQTEPAALTGPLGSDNSTNRFIIKLATPRGITSIAAIKNRVAASLQGKATMKQISGQYYVLHYNQNANTAAVANLLNAADYEYIEPDYIVSHTSVPNDQYLSSQWAHNVVDSPDAWDISQGSSNVTVAVIDSGMDYNHADLAANVFINAHEIAGNGIDDDGNGFVDDIHGWNFVSDTNNPMADDSPSYHGTHVSGTIGAVGNNGIGISGHAPVVKLLPLKFLGSSGSGYTSDAIQAIDYAISMGAQIISNSWGGSSFSQALSDAISRARTAGILFVVAAGNSARNNDSTAFYPANYSQDNVISVASTTSADKLSSFSNYGVSKVDIGAPGSNIYSTKNGNAYQYLSGTSMATPLVSGVLATMVALRPELNYLQLKSILLASVDVLASLKEKVLSEGRINAARALSATAMAPSDLDPTFPQPPTPACTP